MERGEYDHVQWPTPRLVRRLGELSWSEQNIKHGEERREQLSQEAAYIAFELIHRDDLHVNRQAIEASKRRK